MLIFIIFIWLQEENKNYLSGKRGVKRPLRFCQHEEQIKPKKRKRTFHIVP